MMIHGRSGGVRGLLALFREYFADAYIRRLERVERPLF